jgi:nucleoside-diphosphate-sugar epimerase
MMHGGKPVIYGDGTQTRDFTYVANAVHANLLAGTCEKPLRGESINIACGESFSLQRLLEAVAKHFNVKPECEFAAQRIGEVQHSRASIDAARALIRYEPVVRFDEGLKRTVEWFVNSHA